MTHRKRRFPKPLLVVPALGLAAAVLGAPPAGAQSWTLRYSDIGPDRGPRAESLKWWAGEIEKQTGGKVKVQFFWAQALVKGKDTLKAVGSGLAETGTILGIYTPAELPIWNLANAPFGGRDPWVGMHTWYEMHRTVPELQKEVEKQNAHILTIFTTGPVDILSKTPILSEKDLAGKKIRATGGWVGLLKSLGAVPVNIQFGELYEALGRGTIDGTINYIPFVKSYKHYEVAGHVTEVRMGQVLGYGAGINAKTWSGMPAEVRAAMTRISEQFMDRYARAYLDDVGRTKKELSAGIGGKKVLFHALPQSELNTWTAKSTFLQEWVKSMAAKGVAAAGIVETLNRTRDKYEAELASKGYPWTRN